VVSEVEDAEETVVADVDAGVDVVADADRETVMRRHGPLSPSLDVS